MLTRILVAVICIPLLLVVLFVLPPFAIPVAVSGLAMIAVHEVLWSTKFVQNAKLSGFSILLAGLIPFWVYFDTRPLPAFIALFLYFTMVFVEAISSKHTVTVEKMGGSFFFAVNISYFLSSFIRLDQFAYGKFLLLTPFIGAFLSDTFAYFTGLFFGKRKLAPKLSPNKTVEGSIGGFVGSIVGFLVYGLVMQFYFHFQVNYPLLVVYGVLASFFSQLGDLSFSYVKRQYGLKDFGNIFPGHGGVLDRFDSVIFCAPFIEIMWRILPAVVFN